MPSPIRIRATLLCGLAAALATLAVAATATAGERARTFTCKLRTFDLTPTAIRGEDFGTLRCPGLGRGVQHNTSILTPTAATTGVLNGTSTLYFARGTVRARFKLRYAIEGSTIRFAGTARVVRGTAAYQGVTGSATLVGVSTDTGAHSRITERITVKVP